MIKLQSGGNFTKAQPHFTAKLAEIKVEEQLHLASDGSREEADTSVSSCLVSMLNLPEASTAVVNHANAVIRLGNWVTWDGPRLTVWGKYQTAEYLQYFFPQKSH